MKQFVLIAHGLLLNSFHELRLGIFQNKLIPERSAFCTCFTIRLTLNEYGELFRPRSALFAEAEG